ncbi:MAG: M23 family metallopeptidase [Bacteroidia bacterium]|nr:M23 family metallopeptidase [Bacteroidia bacterium]
MRREKYVFNQNTLTYDKVKLNWKQKLLRVFGFLVLLLGCSFGLYTLAYTVIPTPNEMAMKRELGQMEYQFNSLSTDFENIASQVEELQNRDAEVHRIIFGIDPIDVAVWEGGTGGNENNLYYSSLENSDALISETRQKVERLKYKLALQRNSLDTIFALAKQREEKLISIPSIKPVQEDKLKRKMHNMSGFGIRIHPVHKIKKFHKGIDFTAPRGTAIQATGNGIVQRVEKKKLGYGRNIIIDHGFGYTTLYAHMNEISVNVGDVVTKGQKIGTVGSSGTSTAPHLHYEVRINNKPVNPIDYCMDGLSPEEYKELVIRASIENQSFDY